MGSFNDFKCNKCGFSFPTSGPWEFYRDKKGNIKPYGHPVPSSAEAKKAGIAGLNANVFCLTCMESINNFILVEYKKPVKDPIKKVLMWAGVEEPKEEYRQKPVCPKCKKSNWLLEPVSGRDKIICPRCKKGKIRGECTIIT